MDALQATICFKKTAPGTSWRLSSSKSFSPLSLLLAWPASIGCRQDHIFHSNHFHLIILGVLLIYFWWLQALTALLGGAFALGFLPETRDKTFTQLENIFSRNSGEKELVWIIVFGIPEINVIKFPNRSDLLLERWRCKDDIELFRWRITLQMDCFFFCLNCPEIYRCCQLQAFFVSYIELFTWNERCSEQISQVALFWQKPECRARWRRVRQPTPPLCCANLQPSSCASEANLWSSLQTFLFLS